jgi:bifunctional DNA-binding transcriptional regulator/antitoxin component of YhaV-PrlF toxin-antitoxin module
MKTRESLSGMKVHKVTKGGQISLPAQVRQRWQTKAVGIEDLGDRVVVRPLPDDPIAAARGALKGRIRASSTELRTKARQDEAAAETRR